MVPNGPSHSTPAGFTVCVLCVRSLKNETRGCWATGMANKIRFSSSLNCAEKSPGWGKTPYMYKEKWGYAKPLGAQGGTWDVYFCPVYAHWLCRIEFHLSGPARKQKPALSFSISCWLKGISREKAEGRQAKHPFSLCLLAAARPFTAEADSLSI